MAEYRSYKPRRSKAPQPSILENIFSGLWYLATLPFKQGKKEPHGSLVPAALARQLADRWPSIEGHLENSHTQSLAVSEADKLLDAALQAAGVPGQNMGERLKAATRHFPTALYDQIWQAHKLRNTLAHELDAAVSLQQAASAVQTFRAALTHLGVFL